MGEPVGPARRRRRRGLAPLWRRAGVRIFHDTLRAGLTFMVFLLIGVVAVTEPLYLQLAGTRAVAAQRQDAASTLAAQAAVVRVVGGGDPSSAEQRSYLDELERIPHLGPVQITAASIGYELDVSAEFVPTASADGVTRRVRMFVAPNPHADLLVTSTAADAGVWLPEGLGLHGSRVTLAITTTSGTRAVAVPVAGFYAVDSDGRTPRDPAGSHYWAEWRSGVPEDVVDRRPGELVVADAGTARRLAKTLGDTLRWFVERPLLPGVSLGAARESARAVEALTRHAAADPTSTRGPSLVNREIDSGIPALAAAAQVQLTRTARPVRGLTLAAVGLGMLSALAMTIVTWRRRRSELHHAALLGVRPLALACQGALEQGLPAVVGVGGATVFALVVASTTDLGGSVAGVVIHAALTALAIIGVTSALVGVAVGLMAKVWTDVPTARASRRRIPWLPMLIVLAGSVVGVFAVAGDGAGGAGGVALVIPLLATMTAGALGGYALSAAAALTAGRLKSTLSPSRWRFAGRLAVRRMAAIRTGVVVVTTILGAGIGMLLYSTVSASATRLAIEDRAVVANGAATVAGIEGSYLLDPSAPSAPAPGQPARSLRVPPTPSHTTVVWRIQAALPVEYGPRSLLVVDPTTLDDAASWGRGAELAQARTALATLRARATPRADPVPVIAVGDPSLPVGRIVVAALDELPVRMQVVATSKVFPSVGVGLVAAAQPTLHAMGSLDPRFRPDLGPRSFASPFSTYLWSRDTPSALSSVVGPSVPLSGVAVLSDVSRRPAYAAAQDALRYRLLLTAAIVLIAIIGLAVYVERLVAGTRAADLMLARAGIGRAAVFASQAVEIVAYAAVAVVAALLSSEVLRRIGPGLLEFSPRDRPALVLSVGGADILYTVTASAAVAAVLLGVAASARRERLAREALRVD